MNFPFWGLIIYLALFFFRPQEIYPFLIPLRLALMVPIITVFLVIISGKLKIPKSSEAILFILFFLFSLISALMSPYFNASMEILPELYKSIILFFLIIMVLDDEKSIKKFMWIIFIFTIFDNLVSFYAIKKGIVGARAVKYRFGSYFGGIGGSANEYGLHMLMLLPFPILLIKDESSLVKKAKA